MRISRFATLRRSVFVEPRQERFCEASRTNGRAGFVLLAVLVVIAVLALSAYHFVDVMTSEYGAAVRGTENAQAKAFAVSGVQFAAAALADADTLSNRLGNNPYDNPAALSNVVVKAGDNPRLEGRFALVSVVNTGTPGSDPIYTTKYGVADEAGRININALIQLDPSGNVLYNVLMTLPNMTEDVADSIVDWVDADDDARASGAESSYYSSLNPGYQAKNGPLNSLDELLLVKGVTPQLLYGNDRNRNGLPDDDPAGAAQLDRGWADMLTVYGRELNLDSTGVPRLNVGATDNLPQLYLDLQSAVGQPLSDYVMAYLLYGASPAAGAASGGTAAAAASTGKGAKGGGTGGKGGTAAAAKTVVGTTQMLAAAISATMAGTNVKAQGKITSLSSLVGSQVTLPKAKGAPANAPTVVVNSPLNVADQATLGGAAADPVRQAHDHGGPGTDAADQRQHRVPRGADGADEPGDERRRRRFDRRRGRRGDERQRDGPHRQRPADAAGRGEHRGGAVGVRAGRREPDLDGVADDGGRDQGVGVPEAGAVHHGADDGLPGAVDRLLRPGRPGGAGGGGGGREPGCAAVLVVPGPDGDRQPAGVRAAAVAGRQRSGDRSQKSGDRRQETEGRWQETEGRSQKSEVRRQKAGGRRHQADSKKAEERVDMMRLFETPVFSWSFIRQKSLSSTRSRTVWRQKSLRSASGSRRKRPMP